MKRMNRPLDLAPILDNGLQEGPAEFYPRQEVSVEMDIERLHNNLSTVQKAFLDQQIKAHHAYLQLQARWRSQLFQAPAQSMRHQAQPPTPHEQLAQLLGLHPSQVVVDDTGHCANLPFNRLHLDAGDAASGRQLIPGVLHWQRIRTLGIQKTTRGVHLSLHDLLAALMQQFVRRLVLEDPADFARLKNKPVLYCGNHQVGVESLLFLCLMDVLTVPNTRVIAKAEHRQSWLGALHDLSRRYFGSDVLCFFERSNQQQLLGLLNAFDAESADEPTSLLVHVEGTRALHARNPVRQMSSVLALRHRLPLVPVRFVGGLPVSGHAHAERLEFPIEYGQQDYYVGRALWPEHLETLPPAERLQNALQRLNALGPELQEEMPLPPLEPISDRVHALSREWGVSPVQATLITTLLDLGDVCAETQALLASLATKSHLELSNQLRAAPQSELLQLLQQLMTQ